MKKNGRNFHPLYLWILEEVDKDLGISNVSIYQGYIMELDKYSLVQEQNRIRAKRFYDANKVRINAQKLIQRNANKIIIPKNDVPIIPILDGILIPQQYDEDSIIKRVESLIMNPNTKRKKISSIKVIFNAYPNNNLMDALNHFETMKKRLENANQIKNPELKYSPETIKVIGQSILWIVRNIPIPINPDIFSKYENLVNVLKCKSMEHKDAHKNDTENAVLPYAVYLSKIKSKFGIESVQYLIASIYNEITCRDDIASLIIISKKIDAIDKNTNYLVMPSSGVGSPKGISPSGYIILQHYKTAVLYKKKTFPLSEELTQLIRKYISTHKLIDKLFPSKFNNGLTKTISDMNKKIDISGGINIIRRMKITDFLKTPNLTIEDKVNFATSCFHSPSSQNYYNYIQSDGNVKD